MAQVVNLNKFRKKKAKAEKEARAETNRRLHGRTKAERARDDAQKKRLDAKVRGAFLERDRGVNAGDESSASASGETVADAGEPTPEDGT